MTSIILSLCLAQTYEVRPGFSVQAAPQAAPLGEVVGVGCAAPAGEWSASTVKSAAGYRAPCIAVGRDGWWLATLPASATADDVRRVLSPRVTAPQPDAKLPRKWNPYTQPDYQRRMERPAVRVGRARG